MSVKKSILSILIAFLISNILTTLWYMVMDEANYVPYRRDEINYLGLVLNHFIYAVLMVLLFPSFYSKATKKPRAFLFGVIGSALMFIPQAVVVRSIWKVDFNAIFILNTIAHLIIGGLMGLSISFIYGKQNEQLR